MTIEAILSAPTVRPVYLGFLDFKDDPIYGWTGNGNLAPSGTGDTDLDSNVFLSAEGVIEISPFSDDRGIGEPITVTFAAANMAAVPVILQLVQDRRAFMGRRARFWRAFLTADESAIQPEVQALFTGVMVNAETQRKPGQPPTISITCDQDTSKANVPPARWIDHVRYNLTDTASTFINSLSRGSASTTVYGQPPTINDVWRPPRWGD